MLFTAMTSFLWKPLRILLRSHIFTAWSRQAKDSNGQSQAYICIQKLYTDHKLPTPTQQSSIIVIIIMVSEIRCEVFEAAFDFDLWRSSVFSRDLWQVRLSPALSNPRLTTRQLIHYTKSKQNKQLLVAKVDKEKGVHSFVVLYPCGHDNDDAENETSSSVSSVSSVSPIDSPKLSFWNRETCGSHTTSAEECKGTRCGSYSW